MRTLTTFLVLFFAFSLTANAYEEPEEPYTEDWHKVTVTCYLPTGNPMKNGEEPHRGVIATAYTDDWFGRTVILYKCNEDGSLGECLGIFEARDTGEGHNGSIRKGYVVDVFCESEEDIIPTQKVYAQVITASG